jgi:hypothetical protein
LPDGVWGELRSSIVRHVSRVLKRSKLWEVQLAYDGPPELLRLRRSRRPGLDVRVALFHSEGAVPLGGCKKSGALPDIGTKSSQR